MTRSEVANAACILTTQVSACSRKWGADLAAHADFGDDE